MKYNSSTPITSSTNHNDLTALQGGSSAQYYHLTSAEYAQITALGIILKGPTILVRAASTINHTISSAPSTCDNVTMTSGDVILLKNQTTGSENGVYVFNGAGNAYTRYTLMDTSDKTASGMLVVVSEGTTNLDTMWMLSTNAPITLGTTSLAFTQLGGTPTLSTYSYIVPSVAVGANKLFLWIFNASGSGKVMSITSVCPIIDTDVAVAGALGIRVGMYRISAVGTGGTPWNYKSATLDVAGGNLYPHDTLNAALPAQITGGHLPTGGATISEWVRGMYAMGEETATSNAYLFQGQFNMLDIDDPTAQRFTLREGEGILLKQGAVAATGNIRFRVTFSLE